MEPWEDHGDMISNEYWGFISLDLMEYDDLVIEQRGFCFAYAIRHMYVCIYIIYI